MYMRYTSKCTEVKTNTMSLCNLFQGLIAHQHHCYKYVEADCKKMAVR